MFSITTTELSTSIPTPIASPESEIMLSEIPLKYIITIAKITLTGIEHATITVGFMSRRNRNSMIIAKAAPISRFWSTLPMMTAM